MAAARTAVSFQVDGDSKDDATRRTLSGLKDAGFNVAGVIGVTNLIDYIPGEFLVHVEVDHEEAPKSDHAGDGAKLHRDLVAKGLKPRSQPGSGNLGTGTTDSRLEAAQPHESSLLNDNGRDTNSRNNSSALVRE